MSSTSYALAMRNKNHMIILLNSTDKKKNLKRKKNEKTKIITFKSFKIKKTKN